MPVPRRRGAFPAKLAMIRDAGYPWPIPTRRRRTSAQRTMLRAADEAWRMRIYAARVRRGWTVRLHGVPMHAETLDRIAANARARLRAWAADYPTTK